MVKGDGCRPEISINEYRGDISCKIEKIHYHTAKKRQVQTEAWA